MRISEFADSEEVLKNTVTGFEIAKKEDFQSLVLLISCSYNYKKVFFYSYTEEDFWLLSSNYESIRNNKTKGFCGIFRFQLKYIRALS
ncbi:hypothetical protein AEQU2_02097 [Aequorivita lipolytica]|nr:hypothetical protein AEQU2_02097 [Aequorivita lipolytica]